MLLERGRNVLVVGDRGTGKTSTLHLAELRLKERRRPVVYVSLASADDIGRAAASIYRAAGAAGAVEVDGAVLSAALEPSDPFGPNAALEALRDSAAATIFLVDDVSAVVGHALFGRLRDLMWELDRTWGVAVESQQVAGLLEPPADAFFDRRIHLSPLTTAERRALLASRLGDEASPRRIQQVVDALVHDPFLATGNPRDLIARAQLLLDQADVDPVRLGKAAKRRLVAAAGLVGDIAPEVLRELEARGAVTAGDPDFLAALGWSRPRAVSVLNELADNGILRAYLAPAAGPGRRRKVYEVRPVSDFLEDG